MHNGDGLLQHVVSELVGDEALDNLVHSYFLVSRLGAQLSEQNLIVPIVRALEHLVNLIGCLAGLQALLDHVGAELELAQSHEVAGNEVQDLVVAQLALELEDILDQVVAEGVLDQEVNPADDHVCQRQFLPLQALLQTALHHAAAVLVAADLVTVVHAGAINELCVGGVLLSPCEV